MVFSSCIPSCGKSKKKDLDDKAEGFENSPSNLACGNCFTIQPIPSAASAFVCVSCRSVNRVTRSAVGDKEVDVIPLSQNDVHLIRQSSTIFQLDPKDNEVSPTPETTTMVQTRRYNADHLPQCSVCLDGAGDIVLLPCAHGGLCEECARHIAQNMAVGGAHCPRCREGIDRLVRITLLNEDDIRGIEVKVAQASIRKAPPKVPPPPGSKGKSAASKNPQQQQQPSRGRR